MSISKDELERIEYVDEFLWEHNLTIEAKDGKLLVTFWDNDNGTIHQAYIVDVDDNNVAASLPNSPFGYELIEAYP